MLAVIVCAAVALSICWATIRFTKLSRKNAISQTRIFSSDEKHTLQTNNVSTKNGLGKIESLTDFDWTTTEPEQYRPFKPKYNLTMALETTPVSETIMIDKGYLERINMRKEIMANHTEHVIGYNQVAKPAVDELYEWLMDVYLPTRYPTIFKKTTNPSTRQLELYNKVTTEYAPLSASNLSIDETFQIMARMVEDDFMILLPNKEGTSVELTAFLVCFPNSFNAPGILNKDLQSIHGPVPQYKEKLAKSMDRWFTKLEVGKFARRVNWAVTPYEKLWTPGGHHVTDRNDQKPINLNINQSYVRSERQIIFRLPKSNAVILSVKQYMYPLQAIKEEGSGPALAEAVDGLKLGNVPQIHFYKRAEEWSDSLKKFLLS